MLGLFDVEESTRVLVAMLAAIVALAVVFLSCTSIHPSTRLPERRVTVEGHTYNAYREGRQWSLRHDPTCMASHEAMYHNETIHIDTLFNTPTMEGR